MVAAMRMSLIIGSALLIGLVSTVAAAVPERRSAAPSVGAESVMVLAQKPSKTKPNQFRPRPSEQDRTLDDLRQGRIKSFSDIRRRVSRRVDGRIIDAQLDRFSTPWVYKLRVLTENGEVLSVRVNAETGQVLNVAGGKR